MRIQILGTAVVCGMLAACAAEPEPPAPEATPEAATPTPAPLPEVIVAERGGFIPEGIEYDMTNHRLLTGSLTEGSILQLHGDGRVTPIGSDPDLVSSIGIEVDELRGRLLVANSDFSVFQSGGAGQALGLYGYYAGPGVHILDVVALTDPLLARLPARSGRWRIGHFERAIPPGYARSLDEGQNRITDPALADYYEDLRRVARGPLFSVPRWRAIGRLNFEAAPETAK